MGCITLLHGQVTTVDDEKLSELSKYSWRLHNDGYVVRSHPKRGRAHIPIHREVMGAKPGQIVDHINGDKLDNRVANLRFATHSQNQWNMRKNKPITATSRFKGVSFYKKTNRYVAQISLNGQRIHIGYYKCEHQAAHEYNKKAIELFGEFAALNPVGY